MALKLELHYGDEQRTKLLHHEKTKYATAAGLKIIVIICLIILKKQNIKIPILRFLRKSTCIFG